MRRTVVAALLALAFFSIASLVRGATYLEAVLPGGLPLGNVLVAVALCAIAGSALVLSEGDTALRIAALASLLAALVWLPVSIALSGNLGLNFDGDRAVTWLVFSFVVAVGAIGVLLWAFVASALRRRRA
jgi:hypothetical protein